MEIVKSVTSDRIGKLAEAYTATGLRTSRTGPTAMNKATFDRAMKLLEAQEATSQLIQDLDEPTFEYEVAGNAARNLQSLLSILLQDLAVKGIKTTV